MYPKIGRAAVLALEMVGVLLAAPAIPASADTVPPTQYAPVALTDMSGPSYLLSQPDGGVTLGCAGGAIGTKRISAAGVVTQNMPNAVPYPSTCARNAVVGKDGTLFTMVSSSNGWPSLKAIKGGVVKWTYDFFDCLVAVQGMVIGTDGNVYVLKTGLLSPCGGQSVLMGFKPTATGTPPTVVMNKAVANDVLDGGIAAYTGGLVLRTRTGMQYVTYAGVVGQPLVVADSLSNVSQDYADATLAGRLVVPIRATAANVQVCGNDSWVVGSLNAFDPSGQKWVYSSLPACAHVYEIRPTFSGGVVVRYDVPAGGVSTTRKQYLLALSGTGKYLWSYDLALSAGVVDLTSTFAVDLNGNVALMRWVKYMFVETNGANYLYPALQLKLLSGVNGSVVGTYDFSGGHSDANGSGYNWYGNSFQLSTGHNVWYAPVVKCYTWGNCDSASAKFYAVTVPGLQMDYPRGAILSSSTTLNYAALGDSFSSGEGVPPFLSPSDTNGCHRSNKAYPLLLAGTSTIGWKLTAVDGRSSFVACSGETVQEMAVKKNGEEPQLSALTTSTKVVTISVGGNDVPFRNFVVDCLFVDCSVPADNQPYFASISTLGSKLGKLYDDIHAKAPNAKVYVLGYPQLLSVQGCPQTNSWMVVLNQLVQFAKGGGSSAAGTLYAIGRTVGLTDDKVAAFIASGVVEFNTSEVATARLLVQQLDQAIKGAVTTLKPWLVYVDPLTSGSPFLGHELCTNKPYFNGLDLAANVYSFHPNSYGQEAYKQLILQRL